MSSINTKEVKQLEFDVTKKLFTYIYANIDLNKVIEELDKDYSYFYDADNNIAFNIWLSLDYIYKDEKTFTEIFLEDKVDSLSIEEKKILGERKDSYLSLFKIVKFDGKHTLIKDLLTQEDFYLLEPELPNIIKEGAYVFSRIGKSFDNYNFIGDINYLPSSCKYNFIKGVLKDFNITRKFQEKLTMKEYLKRFGLNLYKIYDRVLFDSLDIKETLDLFRIDDLEELGEFEDYLSLIMDEEEMEIHLSNLSDLVPFYFASEYASLNNLLDIDIDDIILASIDNAIIVSRKDLMTFIDTLKLYFGFLSNKSNDYYDLFNQIDEISKSPFKYIRHVNSYDTDFSIDRNFTYYVESFLNEKAENMINDFDMFLLFLESDDITLTPKKKLIPKKILSEIEGDFKNKTSPLPSSLTQRDFLSIDLYYKVSLDLDLLKIKDDKLIFDERAMNCYMLDISEKYALVFEYFLNSIIKDGHRDFLLKTLNNMDSSKNHPYDLFLLEDEDLLSQYGYYLNLLGLLNYNPSINERLSITSLGKVISKFLSYNDYLDKDNLIDLFEKKK